MRRRVALLLPLAFLALLLAAIWSPYRIRTPATPIKGQVLFLGAIYDREIRHAPRLMVLHFITIDLTTPGLRFLVTPPDFPHADLPLRARTTSAFLRESSADIAISGDFNYPWKSNTPLNYYPHAGDRVTVQGYAASNGVPYGNNVKRWVLPAPCFSADGKASIRVMKPDEKPPYNAVGGGLFLLQNGQATEVSGEDSVPLPCAGVALDRLGKHLIIVVADGRQAGYSEGVTTRELALLLRERGGYTAINLDGGGSSTLAAREKTGLPRVLNSTINHSYFVGSEVSSQTISPLFSALPKR